MLDIQKEKKIIIDDINTILKDLHGQFPWVVVELAMSLQERIGKDNPFVKAAFKDVLDDMSTEVLDKYIPECTPEGIVTSDVATSIYNSFNVQGVQDVLAKPVFSLDEEVSDDCLPWDYAETQAPAFYGIGNSVNSQKLNLIRKIKMDLKDLAFRQAVALKKEEEFKDELEAISIIFDTLDFLN